METNQIFSFKRFYLLLRNDLYINYKKYLLSTLGAFLFLFVFLYINMPNDSMQYFRVYAYTPYLIFALLGLGVFVGQSFPEFGNKSRSSNHLLLPASTLEKFLAQFLIRMILGTTLVLVLFWLDAHLARWVALNFNSEISGEQIATFSYSGLKSDFQTKSDIVSIVLAIFSIGAFLFSVRLFFKKNALVKSIIALFALFFTLYCLMVVFSHLFYPETKIFSIELPTIEITSLKMRNIDLFSYTIACLSWLFLLPLGYFKLKERQV